MFRLKKENKSYNDPIIINNKLRNFVYISGIPLYDTFFLEPEGIIIQQFLDKILQKEESVIIGFFCDISIDQKNKKNIIRKLSVNDEKLIKEKKRREKHKMNLIDFFYLKKNFQEKNVLKIYNKYFYLDKKSIKELESVNLMLTFSDTECLRLYISKKFIKEAQNMLEAFQKMGYRISGKIE